VVVIVVLLMALDYKSGYPRWVFQAQERELATGLASSLPHTLSIQLPNTVLDCLPVRQEPTASVRGPSPVKIWEGRDSGDLAGWSDSARRGFQQPDDGQYEMLRAQWKRNKATLCDASRDLRAKGVLKRPNASHFSTLFEMAQSLVGLLPHAPGRFGNEFYGGNQGGYCFGHSGRVACYLIHWKCANDQMSSYLRSQLKEAGVEMQLFEAHQTREFQARMRKADCIFYVLRDPVSHFLSGYNEVEFRLEGFREGEELSMHHSRAAESAHFTSFRDGATERFEAFVTDILKGHSNWKHGHGWELKTKHESQHVFPMSGVLGSLLGDGEIQPTGSVPLETMQTSVPSFLTSEQCGFPKSVVPVRAALGRLSALSVFL
jgi:hypothetical protein